MKKYFPLVLMLMLSSSVIAADATTQKNKTKPLDSENAVKPSEKMIVKTNTVCIGGYLFALATQSSSAGSGGISMVQIMKSHSNNWPPQPISCY